MAELQCAYSVLEYKHKELQSSRQKRPGNGKGKTAKKPKGDAQESQAAVTKEECKFYCHSHGYQNSHNSNQCKVMINQPKNFNAEMRRAKDPHNPPGGSTAIRGKQPTVHASAFMITNANPEPNPPNELDQDATHPTPPSVLPHHAQPFVNIMSWR